MTCTFSELFFIRAAKCFWALDGGGGGIQYNIIGGKIEQVV